MKNVNFVKVYIILRKNDCSWQQKNKKYTYTTPDQFKKKNLHTSANGVIFSKPSTWFSYVYKCVISREKSEF